MHDLTGQTIDDRFRVERLLGEGGMGAVYLATQLSVDRTVALKVIHEEAADEVALARFEREARHVSGLTHPHIAALIDFGTHEGMDYLVMEYVDGESLGDLIEGGLVASPAVWLEVLTQVASGLVAAHAHGVIHRDLKPDNILCARSVGDELLLKLVDFGIARASQSNQTLDTLTDKGSIVGTPAYMSPEQARGEAVDARTDLFSLGVIAYELACGERPFDAEQPLPLLMKICNTPHPPLASRLDPDVWPAELRGVAERLLAKDPAARFASSRELHKHLKSLRRELNLPPVHVGPDERLEELFVTPGPSAHPTSQTVRTAQDEEEHGPAVDRRLALAALAVGVLVVVLGVVAFSLATSPPREPIPLTASADEPEATARATPEGTSTSDPAALEATTPVDTMPARQAVRAAHRAASEVAQARVTSRRKDAPHTKDPGRPRTSTPKPKASAPETPKPKTDTPEVAPPRNDVDPLQQKIDALKKRKD